LSIYDTFSKLSLSTYPTLTTRNLYFFPFSALKCGTFTPFVHWRLLVLISMEQLKAPTPLMSMESGTGYVNRLTSYSVYSRSPWANNLPQLQRSTSGDTLSSVPQQDDETNPRLIKAFLHHIRSMTVRSGSHLVCEWRVRPKIHLLSALLSVNDT
jgi:hypothetical protein